MQCRPAPQEPKSIFFKGGGNVTAATCIFLRFMLKIVYFKAAAEEVGRVAVLAPQTTVMLNALHCSSLSLIVDPSLHK